MQALDLSKIGCSDLACLVGEDPWREPIDLYNRIVHGIEVPASRWLEEAGDLGRRYERGTAEALLVRRLDLDPTAALLAQPPSRTPGHRPWQRYSLDFTVGVGYRDPRGYEPGTELVYPSAVEPRIIECKIRNSRSMDSQGFGDEGTAEVPLGLVCQVTGQLEAVRADRDWWGPTSVPEVDVADVAVVRDGQALKHYPVPYDAELGGLLVDAAAKFWADHVEPATPPPFLWGEGTRRELLRRHPSPSKTVRALDDDDEALELAELYHAAKVRRDAADKELAELEARMCQRIGADYGIEHETFRAIWFAKSGAISWRAFVDELAKLAGLDRDGVQAVREKHRGDSRREFRLTWRGGKIE